MPKYYTVYGSLRLVLDAGSPEKAARLVMQQRHEKLKTNAMVYVDERGHRTRHADSKFRVCCEQVDGWKKWTLVAKKRRGR